MSFNTPSSSVGLFFTDDGSSYNPTSGVASPQLAAFSDGTVTTPTPSGSSVPDYKSGTSSPAAIAFDAYNGNSSFTLDGEGVSITGYTYTGTTATLSLLVAVPEPTSMGACLLGLATLGFARRRGQGLQ